MKLYLKRDTSMAHSRFVVFDATGCDKYVVTGKYGAIHKLAISDLQGKVLASIHMAPFKSFKAFVISGGEERFLMVASAARQFLHFSFHGINWSMCRSADGRSFDIIASDSSVVMSQNCDNLLSKDYCELEIFNESRELFCIAVAICANLINFADLSLAVTT